MKRIKKIGLVAHDARKNDMLDWVKYNAESIIPHKLICTGTTGQLVAEMFEKDFPHLSPNLTCLKSGPLGGDQQMGALIASGDIDILIFLTDPMTTQPHDVDIKALIRLCSVYNTILACNKATADFVISSPLFKEQYAPVRHDYSKYLKRNVEHGDF